LCIQEEKVYDIEHVGCVRLIAGIQGVETGFHPEGIWMVDFLG
jgi:hypothetical protein